MDNTATDWAAWVGAITGVISLLSGSIKYFFFERSDQRKQSRASLSVEGGAVTIENNKIRVEFQVFNRGQVAAEQIKYAAVVGLADEPQFNPSDVSQVSFPELEYNRHQPLANAASIWFNIGQYISDADSLLVLNGLKSIHIKGKIQYTDCFKNQGTLILDCRQATQNKSNSWALSPYENANEN